MELHNINNKRMWQYGYAISIIIKFIFLLNYSGVTSAMFGINVNPLVKPLQRSSIQSTENSFCSKIFERRRWNNNYYSETWRKFTSWNYHSLLFSSYSSDELKSQTSNTDKTQKVNVTFETASGKKSFDVRKGEILRSAMLKRGVSVHNGNSRLINCRGLGTCGTCAVEIDCKGNSNAVEPKARNVREKIRLNFPPHNLENQSPYLRLACQVQVQDDIVVKKREGFWGQGINELANEYEAQLWFGDQEYILDNKSPSNK